MTKNYQELSENLLGFTDIPIFSLATFDSIKDGGILSIQKEGINTIGCSRLKNCTNQIMTFSHFHVKLSVRNLFEPPTITILIKMLDHQHSKRKEGNSPTLIFSI